MTRLIMAASAIVLGLAGIAASFAPHELLAALGVTPSVVLPVVVQLHGAMLLGFAMLNWMAKDSLIGGIYNRPVTIGNLLHFVAGALALVKFVFGGHAPALMIVAAVVYAVFAIAFARIMFRSPVAPA
jgi:hypothetical protein